MEEFLNIFRDCVCGVLITWYIMEIFSGRKCSFNTGINWCIAGGLLGTYFVYLLGVK